MPKFVLLSNNNGSVPLCFDCLKETKAALKEIFSTDAAMEGQPDVDSELLLQIDALDEAGNGAILSGFGITETVVVVRP